MINRQGFRKACVIYFRLALRVFTRSNIKSDQLGKKKRELKMAIINNERLFPLRKDGKEKRRAVNFGWLHHDSKTQKHSQIWFKKRGGC